MHHSAIVPSGPQTNSSIARGLCSPEAAPEPKPYRRNLCSGSLEPGRMGLILKASVSTLPFLGILAVTECHALIAKKSPPRLLRPSAPSRHVARHGGLGDAETQHQKFTMDPRRTPEKVLGPSLPSDDGLRWKSSGARRASDRVLDIAKALTSHHGASARPSEVGRSPGYRAIAATSARTRSKRAYPRAKSMGDEIGCAPAQRFDGAARSIPTAAR